MWFREHRGGLAESMATAREFHTWQLFRSRRAHRMGLETRMAWSDSPMDRRRPSD